MTAPYAREADDRHLFKMGRNGGVRGFEDKARSDAVAFRQ